MAGKTLFDKVWDSHTVTEMEGETLNYVDRLFIHEGSRHSFSMLNNKKIEPFRVEQIFGFADHYMPTHTTQNGISDVKDKDIRGMIELMEKNTHKNGIRHFGFSDPNQGILHVVPPEQGISQPGLLICGADSHSSTHGAFGNISFGIGASEAAHIMATQCLWQQRPKTLRTVSYTHLTLPTNREV